MSTQFTLGPGAPAPAQKNDFIKDGSLRTFQADVLEMSRKVPVIVDFWAPWCGPCKQLTPILEKLVTAAKGAVRLVKINVDENQQIAQQLRIQSIPTVYAFKNGQPVDGFAGALPESQVKQFIERLGGAAGPSPADELLAEAEAALAAKDAAAAAQLFAAVLQEEPGHPVAAAGLARCYLANGDYERARQALELAAPESKSHQAIESVKAELALAEQAGDRGAIAGLSATLAANPKDHQARYDLALALIGANDRDKAVSELLEIVRQDRQWNDQAARKQLLTLFEALGPTHELTLSGRKRLSAILFS